MASGGFAKVWESQLACGVADAMARQEITSTACWYLQPDRNPFSERRTRQAKGPSHGLRAKLKIAGSHCPDTTSSSHENDAHEVIRALRLRSRGFWHRN